MRFLELGRLGIRQESKNVRPEWLLASSSEVKARQKSKIRVSQTQEHTSFSYSLRGIQILHRKDTGHRLVCSSIAVLSSCVQVSMPVDSFISFYVVKLANLARSFLYCLCNHPFHMLQALTSTLLLSRISNCHKS